MKSTNRRGFGRTLAGFSAGALSAPVMLAQADDTNPTAEAAQQQSHKTGNNVRSNTMTTNAHRIKTDPDNYEPFKIAQAYRVGNLIFVSGQAAIDDDGAIVAVGDFEAQARRSIENLARVLEAGGSGLDKLVKVTILVTDIAKFDTVVKLREEYFTAPYPADTIFEVRSLALPDLLFEIEAVALADGRIIDA